MRMAVLTQKKFSIDLDQKQFLEDYRQWGFSDQSSIVREALARYMDELKTSRRKTQMAQKARELVSDYQTDDELTAFTDLDGEDFL
jgi:metal-responsive CopG/Arc/MetJ family transcriptional regulator